MRKVDPELCAQYRGIPCICCGSRNSVGHHIKSKGSGGDDAWYNLIPLCIEHHNEVHMIPTSEFVKKWALERVMLDRGWNFDEFFGKWVRNQSDFFD